MSSNLLWKIPITMEFFRQLVIKNHNNSLGLSYALYIPKITEKQSSALLPWHCQTGMLAFDKHEWLYSYHCRKGNIKRYTFYLPLTTWLHSCWFDWLSSMKKILVILFILFFFLVPLSQGKNYYLSRWNIFLEREVWVDVKETVVWLN